MKKDRHALTGAFGYSGKYIAKRLLDRGHEVITLTNSPDRVNPFAGRVKPCPFNFDNPEELTQSLRGVSVLYNTYWVRFNHKLFKHADAVRNIERLFEAAKEANVERIVHVSITNPSEDSPLEYFSGKARLERALADSGISHAILRPTVLFGKEDILINNIAWALRRLPVFGVFGSGEYRLQPIYVDDIAALAVEQGAKRDNVTIDAIGPETFTYRELVNVIGEAIGKKRPVISVPLLECRQCGQQVSLTAGTIMHRTRQPLPVWFWAAYLVTTQTPGMSALQFQKQLGIKRYETAFLMLHKLRAAMVRPGRDRIGAKWLVEVDETYVGGATQGDGRGRHHKTLVVGMVEVLPRKKALGPDPNLPSGQRPQHRGGHGRGFIAGRLRLQVIPNRKQETLEPTVLANIQEKAEVRTDGWTGYDNLHKLGYKHTAVPVRGDQPRLTNIFQ